MVSAVGGGNGKDVFVVRLDLGAEHSVTLHHNS